ncbi:DNA-binding protein [Alsobacter soli]|uniref:DNA-binding protein n=1 Tax=Alsobacter soli TaxID=2109933 RepID=A0A2T1HQ62_9HYPH|nr:helix-turn-helix domain-containing protein [Alsobacter soli]PSC03808.1 DNA-binding protein [Alsobacter soli]
MTASINPHDPDLIRLTEATEPTREEIDLDDLATAEEAADMLRISLRWLEKLRADNSGPACIKLGRRFYYPRSAVRAWATARLRRSKHFDLTAA